MRERQAVVVEAEKMASISASALLAERKAWASTPWLIRQHESDLNCCAHMISLTSRWNGLHRLQRHLRHLRLCMRCLLILGIDIDIHIHFVTAVNLHGRESGSRRVKLRHGLTCSPRGTSRSRDHLSLGLAIDRWCRSRKRSHNLVDQLRGNSTLRQLRCRDPLVMQFDNDFDQFPLTRFIHYA